MKVEKLTNLATALAFGTDPTVAKLDTEKMRIRNQFFEDNLMTLFSTLNTHNTLQFMSIW